MFIRKPSRQLDVPGTFLFTFKEYLRSKFVPNIKLLTNVPIGSSDNVRWNYVSFRLPREV